MSLNIFRANYIQEQALYALPLKLLILDSLPEPLLNATSWQTHRRLTGAFWVILNQ
jgi:hypothetical protein